MWPLSIDKWTTQYGIPETNGRIHTVSVGLGKALPRKLRKSPLLFSQVEVEESSPCTPSSPFKLPCQMSSLGQREAKTFCCYWDSSTRKEAWGAGKKQSQVWIGNSSLYFLARGLKEWLLIKTYS